MSDNNIGCYWKWSFSTTALKLEFFSTLETDSFQNICHVHIVDFTWIVLIIIGTIKHDISQNTKTSEFTFAESVKLRVEIPYFDISL